jgi:hypothetical protein
MGAAATSNDREPSVSTPRNRREHSETVTVILDLTFSVLRQYK